MLPLETDDPDKILGFLPLFSHVIMDIDRKPLVIDEFRCYWRTDPTALYPGAARNLFASTTLNRVDFTWSLAVGYQRGFFLFTAVDEDGVVVAASRPGLIRNPEPGGSAVSIELHPDSRVGPRAIRQAPGSPQTRIQGRPCFFGEFGGAVYYSCAQRPGPADSQSGFSPGFRFVSQHPAGVFVFPNPL